MIAALSTLLLGACSGGKEAAETQPAATHAAAKPEGQIPLPADQAARLGIRFVAAVPAADMPVVNVPATVAPPPNARVAVAATIPGVVTRTLVVEGEQVRAGQPLAIVASREVLTMQAAMEKALARAAVSRTTADRLDQLAREGVIAGARADEARAARRESEAELGEQRRTLALVKASGNGTYALVAPIAGKVTKATIDTGMPVDGTSAPFVIDATDRYELTAQLPERLIGQVRPGMRVDLGGVGGTVTSVGSVVDPATRSASLRAKLPAVPGIVAGQVASVTLLTPAPAGAVAVPTDAVVMVQGDSVVFVRTAKGVVARTVRNAGVAGNRSVLLAGVRAGEQVAASGTSELKALVSAN